MREHEHVVVRLVFIQRDKSVVFCTSCFREPISLKSKAVTSRGCLAYFITTLGGSGMVDNIVNVTSFSKHVL